MNKEAQCTDTVMMVRPACFGFNDQTAVSNSFQKNDDTFSKAEIQKHALAEFDILVDALRDHGITVMQVEDTPYPVKPDAVFPNNWITTHSDGVLITYPMYTTNRRAERREDIISWVEKKYKVKQRYSFEGFEEEGLIMEGTGSKVLDRKNQILYACLSPRTDPSLLDRFALLRKYAKVVFTAADEDSNPVYHTNVIMAVGKQEAILCTECIQNDAEKKAVIDSIHSSGKTLIEITWSQVLNFAGNMLQLRNSAGDLYWVMSSTAFLSLTSEQKTKLQKQARIIHSAIPTIEKYGGGSVRCMLAEIFLEEK